MFGEPWPVAGSEEPAPNEAVSPDGRTVVLAVYGPAGFFGWVELIGTDGAILRRRGPER
jgi:hypothetical protein